MKNPKSYTRKVLIEKYIDVGLPPENAIGQDELLGQYELLHSDRFLVEFPYYFEIASYLVNSITSPKFNTSNGKWSNMNIKLMDMTDPSSTQKLFELMQWCYERRKCIDGTNSNEELFSFLLCSIDAVGQRVQRWTIDVENVEFSFGNFDYNSNDISFSTMNLKIKNCVLNY